MSAVSAPVITKGETNAPVTTHDPAGTGEVANKGLGTVVAPGGAWPDCTMPNPDTLVSKAQNPCNLFAFTLMVESFTLKLLI
mgnify:CR=1 FL=1